MVTRLELTQDDIADDWPKVKSWGFPDVKTYRQFVDMVGDDVEAIGMFVQLPAWNPAPEDIKAEVLRHYPELADLFFAMPGEVVKHLPGEHDQLSHGSWARRPVLAKYASRQAIEKRPKAYDTMTLYSERQGKAVRWDAGRVSRYHDKYVAKYMANGRVNPDGPTFTVMGGGPASGKSTLEQSLGFDKTGAVVVNADKAKDELPEFRRAAKAKDPAGAAIVHEESSAMSKRLQAESLDAGFDTVLDGTGDSTVDNLKSKIDGARARGARRVVAEYVTLPTGEALRRMRTRGASNGRFVPPSVLRGLHEAVSATFPEAVRRGLFDEARLWDNDVPMGQPPRLVMEHKGGRTTILDPAAWESFLRKNPNYKG